MKITAENACPSLAVIKGRQLFDLPPEGLQLGETTALGCREGWGVMVAKIRTRKKIEDLAPVRPRGCNREGCIKGGYCLIKDTAGIIYPGGN